MWTREHIYLEPCSGGTSYLYLSVFASFCCSVNRLALMLTYVSSSIYRILASSLLLGLLVAVLLFFSFWQVTAFLAAKLLSLCVGIGVTFALKWLVTRTCRITLYQGFYRKKPFSANFIEVLNESFNFATTVAIAVVRMLKLILLAAFYVGRTETKFLATGVGTFYHNTLVLDSYPDFFISDLLCVEAHRHPYIETLGVLYLYKLKYGQCFISRAGSAWRILFVTALMPWLQKYRFDAKGKGCILANKVPASFKSGAIGNESEGGWSVSNLKEKDQKENSTVQLLKLESFHGRGIVSLLYVSCWCWICGFAHYSVTMALSCHVLLVFGKFFDLVVVHCVVLVPCSLLSM